MDIVDSEGEVGQVDDPADQAEEPCLCAYDHEGGQKASFIEAAAYAEARDAGCPETCGCGKADDRLFSGNEDGAAADEAQAGYDLGRKPGGVGRDPFINIEINARHGRNGACNADQHMGPETCGPVAVGPFNAYQGSAESGQDDSENNIDHGHIS